MSDLTDAWETHARIQLYVLDAVAPEALDAKGLKGRSVGHQVAHIHDVRRMWLQSAALDLLEGIDKLGKDHNGDKARLAEALRLSGRAIATLVERAETGGRLKGFTKSPTAFVGYLISHEAYHQGDIGVRLAESGFPLDKKTAFGMFEWGTR
ncbi:MAG: DinB family protein [Acidimicrobiales bacterium]